MKITDIPLHTLVRRKSLFNAAIFNYRGQRWLAYRANNGMSICDLFMVECDKDYNPTGQSKLLKFPFLFDRGQQYKDFMYEDPRYFEFKGEPYLAFTSIHRINGDQRQAVAKLNHDMIPIEAFYPNYLNNKPNYAPRQITLEGGYGVYSDKVCEKNWVFFEDEGAINFIYRSNPSHIIVRCDDKFNGNKQFISTPGFNWPLGLARGGCSPVKVGDIFYHFFHSSTIIPYACETTQVEGRVYFMGCYTFKKEGDDYKILTQSHTPLLMGNSQCEIALWRNLGIFCVGCVFENGGFKVSYGFNDHIIKIFHISKDELDSWMIPVPAEPYRY